MQETCRLNARNHPNAIDPGGFFEVLPAGAGEAALVVDLKAALWRLLAALKDAGAKASHRGAGKPTLAAGFDPGALYAEVEGGGRGARLHLLSAGPHTPPAPQVPR